MKNKALKYISRVLAVCFACSFVLINTKIDANAAASYEPMAIKSGFNYDVIATSGESPASTQSIDAPCGVSAGTKYACFYTTALYSTGGFPLNGVITSQMTSGLNWQLGSYTSNNALKLAKGNTGTLTFSKIGCYQKVYILCVAGGIGSGNSATMQATVNYTDGSTSSTSFTVYDWWDDVYAATKIYRRYCNGYDNSTNCGSTSGAPYLTQSVMTVNTSKLIKSVTIKNNASSSGVYLSVLGVTGLTANVDIPTLTNTTNVTTGGFTINWGAVSNASSYRVDVATDTNFSNILSGCNNAVVNTNSCTISGLDRNTTYYYRVRAVDSSGGQSASSAVKATTTHKCDVYYNDNGGSNGPGMLDLASDWTLQTPVSVPTRTGYTFNGYYTALINGKQYYNASGVRTNTSSFEDYTMNLYAQWTIKESTLTIDANGGRYSGDTTITESYGNSIKINDPTNSDEEKIFLRWEPSNDNCTIVDGAGYTTYIFGAETTAVTLKAIWYSPEQISTQINSNQANTKVENLESLYEYTADGEENGLTSQDFEASSLVVKAIVNDMPEEDSLNEFIEETATHEALKYYDISLVKIVNGVEKNLTEIEKPITITIPIAGDIHGKTGYTVYRIHNGVKEKMTSSRTSPEFYEVKDGNIVIHTKKFSTYAIATSQSVIGVLDESQINDTNNYASTDVQTKYTDGSNKAIYKIDVEWGAMQFTFNKHQKWDPENHRYSSDIRIELDESAYVDGNNEIVVTNHSNADVRVSMVLVDKDIDGVEMALYTTNSAESSLAENMELAKVSNATGSGTVDSTNAYLRFDDGMINSDGLEKLIQNPNVFQTVATIMVTVEPVEGSVLTPKIS